MFKSGLTHPASPGGSGHSLPQNGEIGRQSAGGEHLRRPENFPYLSASEVLTSPMPALHTASDSYLESFANAAPFKHLIFENLFSDFILNQIDAEFDDVRPSDWMRWDSADERKKGLRPNAPLGLAAQAYINTIHSGPFVDFLTKITDIKGLLPDPALKGGGLHEIPQGGKFAVHVDFNRHAVTGLNNRLVLITYLNHDWKQEYGGALELWCADEKRCIQKILPVFGRSILFYQSEKSWHGHPSPVDAPGGRSRRSIAAYYYTNGRDDLENDGIHSSLFVYPRSKAIRQKVTAAARMVTPPILIAAGKKVKRWLPPRRPVEP